MGPGTATASGNKAPSEKPMEGGARPRTTQTTMIPHLVCRGGRKAMAFYEKAFGATTMMAMDGPPEMGGKLMHGAMMIDGAVFFIADEFEECGGKSPQALGGTPVTIHLQVADCDAWYERAIKAGCTVKMPMADMFWGDRYGIVADPFGHNWSIATNKKQLTPEEIKAAMAEACSGQH